VSGLGIQEDSDVILALVDGINSNITKYFSKVGDNLNTVFYATMML
jgi:hypothetical protein